MQQLLRRRRLQRLRTSLVGRTFVEIKNGRGITHRILWVGQSHFGDKPVRVGIKSSNRIAVRWVPHHTYAAASQKGVYDFECRRRREITELGHRERRQPLLAGRESEMNAPSVAESNTG